MSSPAPLSTPPPVETETLDGTAAQKPRTQAEDLRIAQAVNGYFELVWRSLRRFGVPEASADDAAQQVFLIFSQRLASVELGRERSFLLSVAVRVASNTRRQRERSKEVPAEDELEATPVSGRDPEQVLLHKQRRAELDRALSALSQEQRVVFVLYELEGFSLPEIAAALAIPLGTATSRLARGRERFEHWVTNQKPSREP